MLYLDTSVIVALVTTEPHSDRADRWLKRQPDDHRAVSHWVTTELATALAAKVRLKAISENRRRAALNGYREMLRDSLILLDVTRRDFERAAELAELGVAALRGGDALHLAISDLNQATLCTLDKRLDQAGAKIGLPAELL